MAKLICILLFLFSLNGKKNFENSIIEISQNSIIEIQRAKIQPTNYGINHLLDSKIEGTKIAFLSSTLLQAIYPFSKVDQMIHLIKLDLSNSQIIIHNAFLNISLYHSFGTDGNIFYISQFLNVNPLVIYINTSIIN